MRAIIVVWMVVFALVSWKHCSGQDNSTPALVINDDNTNPPPLSMSSMEEETTQKEESYEESLSSDNDESDDESDEFLLNDSTDVTTTEYLHYDDDGDDNGDQDESSTESSDEGLGRFISEDAFSRISATLEAVGRMLMDMAQATLDDSGDDGKVSGSKYGSLTMENVSRTLRSKGIRSIDQLNNTQALKELYSHLINTNREAFEDSIGRGPVAAANETVKRRKKKNKKKRKNKNKNKNKSKKPIDGSLPANQTAHELSDSIQQPTQTELVLISTTSRPTTKSETNVAVNQYADSNSKDVDNRCKTPNGQPGRCQDLSSCPSLLLDFNSLRESLCFKSLFVPGVCCPLPEIETVTTTTTQRPLRLTTKPSVHHQGSNISLILKPIAGSRPPLGSSNELDAPVGPIVNPEDCGQQEYSSGRIVGGVEAPNGEWPWMAAIYLHGKNRTEFWCGGTLIGTRYILTAAHCTWDLRHKPYPAKQFTVRLGDIDLASCDEPSMPATYAVKEVRTHRHFNRSGFLNDIAIMVLNKPVRKSKYVIPLCLPHPNLPPKERLLGRTATVVGWGTTYYGGKESHVQRQAEIPIWRNHDCDRSYFQAISEKFICAGFSDGGVDACQGDSGGPLMLKFDTRWIQLGIVSFGNKCGLAGYPGVYTNVRHYLSWIRDNTRD